MSKSNKEAKKEPSSPELTEAKTGLPVYSFYKSDGVVFAKGEGATKAIVRDITKADDENGGYYEESYQIACMAGPFVSLVNSYYYESGIMDHGTKFIVLDARDSSTVDLLQFFGEAGLLAAFKKDRFLNKYLTGDPATLNELWEMLEDPECKYSFGPYLLGSFAFHHIKNSEVAVRIGISHGCNVHRGTFVQLGMYLPLPAALQSVLQKADERKTLMSHLNPEIVQ